MATAQADYAKFFANNKITMYDHDPADSTVATDIGWVDMQEYERFIVVAFASALTGTGVTAFSILANSSSAGSGTDATVVSHAVGSAPDAVGDYLMLECSAEQVRAVETSSTGQLRYVSASLTCNNAADENVVVYILAEAKFPRAALSADVVA